MSQTITAAVTVQDLAGTAQLLAHSMQRLISASRSLLIAHHLDATDPTLTSILRTLTSASSALTAVTTLTSTLTTIEDRFCMLIGGRTKRSTRLESMREMIENEPGLVNCSSGYDLRHMTALERAVSAFDDVAVAMLFAGGADPSNNCYRGEIPTTASAMGLADMDFMHSYPLGSASGAGLNVVPESEQIVAGYRGLYLLCCDTEQMTGEKKRQCKVMRAWLKCHRIQSLFRILRQAVLTRGIMFYWLGSTMETVCADSGHARSVDSAAFETEFQMPAYHRCALTSTAVNIPPVGSSSPSA